MNGIFLLFSFVVFRIVTCHVFCSNKKIIAVSNWSRADERSAPCREVPMTKDLLTDLTERKGQLTFHLQIQSVLFLTWTVHLSMLVL